LFQAPLLPVVNADMYNTLGSTYSSYNRYVRTNDTFLMNFTKQFSRHTVKFGANYDRVYQQYPGVARDVQFRQVAHILPSSAWWRSLRRPTQFHSQRPFGAGQIWPKGDHPIGYAQQWSFNLQYQLGNHSVLQAGYSGVRGRRLMYGNPKLNANQLFTKDLALGCQLNNIVGNPFFGVITDPNSPLSGETITSDAQLAPCVVIRMIGDQNRASCHRRGSESKQNELPACDSECIQCGIVSSRVDPAVADS